MTEDQTPQETEQVAQAEPQTQQQEHVESDSTINWKKATATMAAQKQEIEALKAYLQQAEQRKAYEAQQAQEKAEEMDPDEPITYQKANTIAERKAKEMAGKLLDEYKQQHALESDEARMRSKHDDYDYVLETYAVPLIKKDPALAYKIQQSRTPAETAYKLGKLSDEYEANMAKKDISPKAEKVLKNVNRPTNSNAVGNLKNQSEEATQLSPQEIWARSQKYARQA
jgi:hypothetical protein